MDKFNRINFNIRANADGTYDVMQRSYLFNLIPIWKEIKYNENNNIKTFKFNSILKAQQFIREICN